MAHLQTWNTTNTLGKEVMSWISWAYPHHEHSGCHWMSAILHRHNYPLSAKSSMLAFFKIKIIMSNTYLKHFNYHSSSLGLTGSGTLPDTCLNVDLHFLFWKTEENCLWSTLFFPPVRKLYDYFCWALSRSVRGTCPGWQDCTTSSITVKLGWKLIWYQRTMASGQPGIRTGRKSWILSGENMISLRTGFFFFFLIAITRNSALQSKSSLLVLHSFLSTLMI